MRFRPIAGIRLRRAAQAAGPGVPGGGPVDVSTAQEPGVEAGDLELRIGGMTCAGCASTIRDGLLQLPGVASAGVSPVTRKAVLRPDGTMDPDDLEMLAEAAILGLGYHVVEGPDPRT